jgi:stage II sporulation protein AB (anti-sigma F factor)
MNNSNQTNYMTIVLQSKTVNEALARSAVAAFCAELNPTVDQIGDIKTAVSEAVNNAIIHGYGGDSHKLVTVVARLDGDTLHIEVKDDGVGIADIDKARQPFYTTKPEQERSGMGFTVMESYMDSVTVTCASGTVVSMTKRIL